MRKAVGVYFRAWKEDYRGYEAYRKDLKAAQQQYIMNRRWKTWQAAYRQSTHIKALLQKAGEHRDTRLIRASIEGYINLLLNYSYRMYASLD